MDQFQCTGMVVHLDCNHESVPSNSVNLDDKFASSMLAVAQNVLYKEVEKHYD